MQSLLNRCMYTECTILIVSWGVCLWGFALPYLLLNSLICSSCILITGVEPNVQKFACQIASVCWDASYDDLLELYEYQTERRIQAKLSLLFMIICI